MNIIEIHDCKITFYLCLQHPCSDKISHYLAKLTGRDELGDLFIDSTGEFIFILKDIIITRFSIEVNPIPNDRVISARPEQNFEILFINDK